jgi:hypothetical protein
VFTGPCVEGQMAGRCKLAPELLQLRRGRAGYRQSNRSLPFVQHIPLAGVKVKWAKDCPNFRLTPCRCSAGGRQEGARGAAAGWHGRCSSQRGGGCGGECAAARFHQRHCRSRRQRALRVGRLRRLGRNTQRHAARARRERPQQPRHPRRGDDLSQLRRLLEPPRSPADLRTQGLARRRPILRLHQDRAGAGRGFQHFARRHVGHLQAAP